MAGYTTGQALINDLLLDVQNPRHFKARSQKDAIAKVLEEQRDKIVKLAESIIDQKGLSPMDRMLVLKKKPSDKGYIVVEGNRRIAVLKILSNPSLMDDAKISKGIRDRLDALSVKFKKSDIEPIDIAIVAKRSDANYWINLRHTGANGGAGVVQWATTQQERFQGPSPQLDVVDFVKSFGGLSDYELGKLDGRFITTLRRLIDSPDVRNIIGIDKAGKSVFSLYPAPEVMKPLKRIVLDLALKHIKVDQIKTVEQMKAYVSGFPSADLPDSAKITDPKPLVDFTAKDFVRPFASSPRPSVTPTSSASPSAKRIGLIPPGTIINITQPRVKVIYDELASLRYAKHINAIGVLFRVFLETSVDAYLHKIGSSSKNIKGKFKSLLDKINEVINDIVSNHGGDSKVFNPLRNALTSSSSPLWIDLLHSYVHNGGGTPTKPNLEAAWDHAFPLIAAIWK